jgi:hypothetical protein
MSRLTLDPTTASKARKAKAIMQVCDASGQLIGHFFPLATAADYAQAAPEVSEEELDRRGRESKGRSLKAILADLE